MSQRVGSSMFGRRTSVLALAVALTAGGLPAADASAGSPALVRSQHVHLAKEKKDAKAAHPGTITSVQAGVRYSADGAQQARLRAHATPLPQAPFTECPAFGVDTSCGVLVVVTDAGNIVLSDPSQGAYDGDDDTLVGVLNRSSGALGNLGLASDTDIFGFDGDGMCSGDYSGTPAACPFGDTGYEGPDTTFANLSPDETSGYVDFPTPLSKGASTYFTLEESLSTSNVVSGGPTAVEQGSAPNSSEHYTTCSTGKPVNCATGDFWHSFTDVKIPGRGVPLELDRTYSVSSAANDSPFGNGWSFSYGMSLTLDGNGNAAITQENGSTVSFIASGADFIAPPRVLATLVVNADGSYTFARRAQHISYTFSTTGQLTSETDTNGEVTDLQYAGGQLVSVTDPSGRAVTFTWSGSHISSVTDPMGRTTDYRYDANGNLVGTTDPAGRAWAFGYDSSSEMTSMTDPRGLVLTNVYDSGNRVVSQTDEAGLTTTWSYSGDPASSVGSTTTMTDAHGSVTTYDYSNLELQDETRASGTASAATTSYRYDPGTLGVALVTNPLGVQSSNSYNTSGDLISATDGDGNTTYYSWTSDDRPASTMTPLGETTSYAYDANGNLVSTTDPLGGVSMETYGDASHTGDLTQIADPDGRIETLTYDSDGDVASTTSVASAGHISRSDATYDADGDKVCSADPDATAAGRSCPAAGHAAVSGTSSWVYDADGEVTSARDPLGHTTTSSYDSDGNTVSTSDAVGRTTTSSFDGDDRTTSTVAGSGTSSATTTSAAFDLRPGSAGCPATAGVVYCSTNTDGRGGVTVNAYDGLGDVVSVERPGGSVTSHAYDAAGNEVGRTDPDGRSIGYAHDNDNRLVDTTYADGSSVSYGYDPDGRRISMTDSTGTTTYTFDADGRTTGVLDGLGQNVGYSHDGAGNVTSIVYPGGQTVQRVFDGAGRMASLTDWNGQTTSFNYDAASNLVSSIYPNGDIVSNSYDAAQQLTDTKAQQGSTTLAGLAYTRDVSGQLTTETDSGALSGAKSYTYDSRSELTASGSDAFTYDASGDPTSLAGTSQTFNPAQELTSAQAGGVTTTYGYDADGNRTSAVPSVGLNQFYTYDQAGELIGYQRTSSPVDTGGGGTGGGGTGGGGTGGGGTGGGGGVPIAKPVIRSITAPFGPRSGAAPVILVGSHFSHAAKVVFGSRAARFKVLSDSRIKVAAPSGKGVVNVRVTTDGGTSVLSRADRYSYLAGAGVYGLSSSHGPAKGKNKITVKGFGFVHVKTVKFGSKKALAFKTLSSTSVAATVPPGAKMVDVVVTAAKGASVKSVLDRYTYAKSVKKKKKALATEVASEASVPTQASYTYNGNNLRMTETTSTGSADFAWDTSAVKSILLQVGSTAYVYGPGALPLEQLTPAGTVYFMHDVVGSTRTLLGSSGSVVGTFSYTPFGDLEAGSALGETALTFAGGYRDADSGDLYLVNRGYHPATAQFLSVDPLVAVTGSAYDYAGSNPANYVDPLGLAWYNPVSWSGTTWAAVGFGVAAVAVGVATFGVGDVVIGAGVTAEATVETTSLVASEEGLALATDSVTYSASLEFEATVDEVVEGASNLSAIGGTARGVYDSWNACSHQLASLSCLQNVAGTVAGAVDPFLHLDPVEGLEDAALQLENSVFSPSAMSRAQGPCPSGGGW